MAGSVTPREVRAALTMIGVAADERIGALLGEFGELGAVDQMRAGAIPAHLAPRLEEALYRSRDGIESADRAGVRFLVPGDEEWPSQLDDLDTSAPVALWIRGGGHLNELCEYQVAIVGARSSTAYGERVASELAAAAAAAGVSVVSGGAYGIDAAAHRGALAAGGPTIAVMAGGADIPYPTAHAGLLDRISQDGAVISEAAPGASVRKNLFLTRNRLIAALASDTVVVEAALRSGALNTANWAGALGRRLWGVPGAINSAASAGVHRSLADGSMQVLTDIDDVISEVRPGVRLGEQEKAIASVMGTAPVSIDMICQWTGMSLAHVLPALTMLELAGAVRRDVDGWQATRAVGA